MQNRSGNFAAGTITSRNTNGNFTFECFEDFGYIFMSKAWTKQYRINFFFFIKIFTNFNRFVLVFYNISIKFVFTCFYQIVMFFRICIRCMCNKYCFKSHCYLLIYL